LVVKDTQSHAALEINIEINIAD